MIKCSKCLDQEHPCSDCRKKILSDLTKALYKQLPLKHRIIFHIIYWWGWLGWIPYRLRIVKLKL